MSTRQDVHRPAVIEPTDYTFVAMRYYPRAGEIGTAYINQAEREALDSHMKATGGTWSRHEHGGQCGICGNVNALDVAIFHHVPSNTYIRTGIECAEKLERETAAHFRHFVQARRNWQEMQKGKHRARMLLEEMGLTRAWEVYATLEAEKRPSANRLEMVLADIVGRLIRYGNTVSDAQAAYIRSLFDQHDNADKIAAQRAAEKAAAEPAPTGRHTVRGTVLKEEVRDTMYGIVSKITVKTVDGWIAWGTAPTVTNSGSIHGDARLYRGDIIEFTAAFTPSDTDPKFAFYKRPTKGSIIEHAPHADREQQKQHELATA